MANIQRIVCILGIDFFITNDSDVKVKKQILKTSSGRLRMYKQTSMNVLTLSLQIVLQYKLTQKISYTVW